jgi:hypothetical protein
VALLVTGLVGVGVLTAEVLDVEDAVVVVVVLVGSSAAMQEQALEILADICATFSAGHPSAANDGIAATATFVFVKVPQKALAACTRPATPVARKARIQLLAAQAAIASSGAATARSSSEPAL